MQRKARGKTRHRLEGVAVEDGRVVIAGFDHDKEIQWIGAIGRPGDGRRLSDDHAACIDLARAPVRWDCGRRCDEGCKRVDLPLGEGLRKARHLRRRAAVGDHGGRPRAGEAAEVFRQQRRPLPAQPVGAVTGGAMLGIEFRRVGLGQGRPGKRQRGD